MPLQLDQPLKWTEADAEQDAMLRDLQANILKGHGRSHTSHLFLLFKNPTQGRAFLRELAQQVTSAREQLDAARVFRDTGSSGGCVTLAFLSSAGYGALVVNSFPPDPVFAGGMAARGSQLADPPPQRWDRHLRGPIHAMVLLADDSAALVRRARKTLLEGLPPGVVLLGEETGLAMESKLSPGEGIEHFGYVDGRSQPLMLQEDIEHERDNRDGTSVWNPTFGLDTALVQDPGGAGPHSFGSYFVFRKLEQNVRAFKKAEARLARALGLNGDDAERAGAMIVGRFEDGTPIAMQRADGANAPVPNNFDYADDPSGSKCPLHGHTRKTNPRGDSLRLGATLKEERSHLMARRGITYGKRGKHPNSKSLSFDEMPTRDVGLLFMAYQADIARQFEFTQAKWVNDPNFVEADTGIDPVIGQGPRGGQRCPVSWGGGKEAERESFDFRGFVSLKGGEYFFAPSISALQAL